MFAAVPKDFAPVGEPARAEPGAIGTGEMKYFLIVGFGALCWLISFWLFFANPGRGYPRAITLIDENRWSLLKEELRKDPSLATRRTEHEDSSAAHALITGRTECFHVLEPYYTAKEVTEERWLILAIESGNLELVEHCLRTYRFDNKLYSDGEGALFWAASLDNEPALRLALRAYRADVNAVNTQGQTALSVALQDPAWTAGAKLLRQNGAKSTL